MTIYKMNSIGNLIRQPSEGTNDESWDLGDGIDIPATPDEAGRFSQYFATREDLQAALISIDHLELRMGEIDTDAQIRLDSLENTLEKLDLRICNIDAEDLVSRLDSLDADDIISRLECVENTLDTSERLLETAFESYQDSVRADLDELTRDVRDLSAVVKGSLDVLLKVTRELEEHQKTLKSPVEEHNVRLSQG